MPPFNFSEKSYKDFWSRSKMQITRSACTTAVRQTSEGYTVHFQLQDWQMCTLTKYLKALLSGSLGIQRNLKVNSRLKLCILFSCQTYEGGFAGVPGMEAHGGYAFCGLAALFLMGKENLINLPAFIVKLHAIKNREKNTKFILQRWVTMRQMKLEGGFQGRTNKLVDGCYSFWQGGAFPLINQLLKSRGLELI